MKSDEVPELRSIWDEAKGHIERGEYDKAAEIYRYVLIRYADYAIAVEYANAYLGDIFLTTWHLDLAEKHLKKAITAAPSNPHYHYLIGFTYSVKEQWPKPGLFGRGTEGESATDGYPGRGGAESLAPSSLPPQLSC